MSRHHGFVAAVVLTWSLASSGPLTAQVKNVAEANAKLVADAKESWKSTTISINERLTIMSQLSVHAPRDPDFKSILLEGIKHTSSEVQRTAASHLVKFGDEGKKLAVPILLEFLKTDNAPYLSITLSGIEAAGASAKDAVPTLIERLKTEKMEPVATEIGKALAAIGTDATASLIANMKSPDVQIRRRAINALALCRGDSKTIVPALTQAMKDKDLTVQLQATQALGKMGRDARSASLALVGIIKAKPLAKTPQVFAQEDPMREAALKALWRVDPNTAKTLGPRPPITIWKVTDLFETQKGFLAVQLHFDSPQDLEVVNERNISGNTIGPRLIETTYALQMRSIRFRILDTNGKLVTFCVGKQFGDDKDRNSRELLFLWPEYTNSMTKESERYSLKGISQMFLVDDEGAYTTLTLKSASKAGTIDERK